MGVSRDSSWSRFARLSGHRAVNWLFGVIAFSLCFWALASHWSEVRVGLGQIGLARTLASAPFMLLGLVFGMVSWRILLGAMGSRLRLADAAAMYFMGQIGKYVPGSLWPVAAQMQLGRPYRIPRGRSGTSILLAICLSLATGLSVALASIRLLDPSGAHRSVWLLLALPPLAAVLYPPLLWRMLRLVPRIGASLAFGPTPRVRDVAAAAGCALLGWVCFGLHVWVLMSISITTPVDPRVLAVCIGGYAFAWVAGLLVFVLPAGAGARDLALVVALSAVLPPQQGLAVAVLSRAVSVACDLGTAGLSAAHVRRLRRRWAAAQLETATSQPALETAESPDKLWAGELVQPAVPAEIEPNSI